MNLYRDCTTWLHSHRDETVFYGVLVMAAIALVNGWL